MIYDAEETATERLHDKAMATSSTRPVERSSGSTGSTVIVGEGKIALSITIDSPATESSNVIVLDHQHSDVAAGALEELRRAAEALEDAAPGPAVSETARRLSGLLVWMLPKPFQQDKAEEFASELWELAAAGQPFRAQLGYTLRLLAMIVPLRRELSAVRRMAGRG